MSIEQNLHKWIAIDNELKTLNEKLKTLRLQKNNIEIEINKNTELSNKTIRLNDSILKFVQVKETQPLTFKYLETCLHEIIKSEEQVKHIIEYIKNKRDIKYNREIKRFSNN